MLQSVLIKNFLEKNEVITLEHPPILSRFGFNRISPVPSNEINIEGLTLL